MQTARKVKAGILERLAQLNEQLKANSAYAPNKTENQTATVTERINDLRTIHNNALAAKTDTRTARNDRDEFAYNETDGLMVRINALKNYLGTILDKNDPHLKSVNETKICLLQQIGIKKF